VKRKFQSALIAATLVTAAGYARTPAQTDDVTVHEWGTFTSVAAENGQALQWFPLDAPTDLPCFVKRSYPVSPKEAMFASVRMETPVLYFYAPRDRTVDVRVGFRQGLITEYFPSARVNPETVPPARLIEPGLESTITWHSVRILPGAAPEFLDETTPNHYYAARATDAAPVEIGGDRERFLFYRGVGNFTLPITASVVDGNEVVVAGGMPWMMLFENRGGRAGYRVLDGAAFRTLPRPELNDDEDALDVVDAVLGGMLEARGLYPREARAMIETWRDSWFTEGSRLFYVVPQATIDAVLPLQINPAPARVVRVFVGRLELATEATLADLRIAALTGDTSTMRKYGRFLRPFADRLLARTESAPDRARLARSFESIAETFAPAASACR